MLGFIDDTGKAILNHTTLIALLGVGYAGTDFIESFLAKYATGNLPATVPPKSVARTSDETHPSVTEVSTSISTAKVAALCICFFCGGLPTHSMAQSQNDHAYQTETEFKDFIPVVPFMYDVPVTITDSTGRIDTLSIQKLALNRSQMLRFLANEGAHITIRQIDEDGQVKFLANTLSGKNSNYSVVVDYSNFTTVKVFDAQKHLTGTAKLGVGVRLTANLLTREADLNIGDLFSLALAAERKQAIGSLSIDIIGITSDQVTALVPLPSEISLTSIQAAMQALASIKAKIYEDSTTLMPQVLALKPEKDSYTSNQIMVDLMETGRTNRVLTTLTRK